MYTGQMKRRNTLLAGGFIAFAVLVGATTAHATVGGPTLIGSFSYNPENESVYYILESQDGRGCPPSLRNISLASEAITTELSCNEGEDLIGSDYSNQNGVFQRISEMTQGFKYLNPINLSKNDIAVDVNFVESETLEGSPEFIIRSQFVAEVYQGGKKIDGFEIQGCDVDQPFSFAGYAIPGFEKKIILLSSTKGDCWEGGYSFERLHVIGGLSVLDRTSSGNEYKSQASALVPGAGTLVVFEKDAAPVETSVGTTTPDSLEGDSGVPRGTIAIAVAALLLGIFVGRLYFPRR